MRRPRDATEEPRAANPASLDALGDQLDTLLDALAKAEIAHKEAIDAVDRLTAGGW